MEIEIDFGNDGYKIVAKVSKDGSKWCVLWGDDLQSGIAGFGDELWFAITEFKENVRNAN